MQITIGVQRNTRKNMQIVKRYDIYITMLGRMVLSIDTPEERRQRVICLSKNHYFLLFSNPFTPICLELPRQPFSTSGVPDKASF